MSTGNDDLSMAEHPSLDRRPADADLGHRRVEATLSLRHPLASLEQNLAAMMEKIRPVLELVAEQAKDEGLFFDAGTAPEGYLQQELRQLHVTIDQNLGTLEALDAQHIPGPLETLAVELNPPPGGLRSLVVDAAASETGLPVSGAAIEKDLERVKLQRPSRDGIDFAAVIGHLAQGKAVTISWNEEVIVDQLPVIHEYSADLRLEEMPGIAGGFIVVERV